MKAWAFEVVALGLFTALGVAGLWAAGQITAIAFDPLGSTAAPYVIGTAVVVLSLACGIKLIGFWPGSQTQAKGDEDLRTYTSRNILEVLALLGLVMAYVSLLFSLHVPFSLATLALVPTAACLLEWSVRTRSLPIALAAGGLIGFGGELLFTKAFFVDLPALW